MLPGSTAWDRPQTDSPWSLLLCHQLAAHGYVCHISHLGTAGCCNKRNLQLATSCWSYTQVWKRKWCPFPGQYKCQKGPSKALVRLPTCVRTFQCWPGKNHAHQEQSSQHSLSITPLSPIQYHWEISYFLPTPLLFCSLPRHPQDTFTSYLCRLKTCESQDLTFVSTMSYCWSSCKGKGAGGSFLFLPLSNLLQRPEPLLLTTLILSKGSHSTNQR